jgi:hypothetical protein
MPTSVLERELGVSEADVRQMLAEIERFLDQHPPKRGIVLPPVDELIRQAGIQTGPAPLPRRGWLRRRPAATTGSIADHLEQTAAVIQRYGWTQHTTRDGQGRFCIVGAQLLLVRLGQADHQVAVRAGEWLNRHLGTATGGYIRWQNNPSRTKAEVLTTLRAAADTARTAGA